MALTAKEQRLRDADKRLVETGRALDDEATAALSRSMTTEMLNAKVRLGFYATIEELREEKVGLQDQMDVMMEVIETSVPTKNELDALREEIERLKDLNGVVTRLHLAGCTQIRLLNQEILELRGGE